MKQKLKGILKIGSLLFGFSILIFTCQKESIYEAQENPQERKFKMISLDELNSKIGKSKDYDMLSPLFDVNVKKSNQNFRKLDSTDNPWLETDKIAMIEKGNTKYYTFKVGTNSTDKEFYNLVVIMDEEDKIISTSILEYIPSDEWVSDKSQPFKGDVKLQENDIFFLNDLNATYEARGGCITGVNPLWNCGDNND